MRVSRHLRLTLDARLTLFRLEPPTRRLPFTSPNDIPEIPENTGLTFMDAMLRGGGGGGGGGGDPRGDPHGDPRSSDPRSSDPRSSDPDGRAAAARAAAAAEAMMQPMHPFPSRGAPAPVSPWDQVALTAVSETAGWRGAPPTSNFNNFDRRPSDYSNFENSDRRPSNMSNMDNYGGVTLENEQEWCGGLGGGLGARFGYLFPGSVILGVDCVVGPHGYCSPRHRMPLKSSDEGTMRFMTWRALSISTYCHFISSNQGSKRV